MSIKKKALGFAHLLGLSAAASEEEDRKDKMDEKDEKEESAEDEERREGESDEDYEKRTGKKAKKAEDDKEDPADAENDSDDEEAEEEEDEKEKAARERERARCSAIVAYGMKNGCAAQAGVLAFDTTLSAKTAIATLKASKLDGGNKGAGLRDRMASQALPRVGADGGQGGPEPTSPEGIAAKIIAAGAKARGESV